MTDTAEHPAARLGAVRQTYAGEETFPPLVHAFREVAIRVRDAHLLRRARWFYTLAGLGIAVALGGCVTGFILLGESWLQLLIAAAVGILFTQIAFIAHEAGHRQVLAKGPANVLLARILGGVVGMSFSWWDTKHTRHHGNPNQVDKDPDIAMDTISFLEDDARASRGIYRFINQRQGWLFFPLLTLEGLNLHAMSVKHLASRSKIKGRWTEIGIIAARFAVVLVPLFLLLPLGMAFAFLGVQLAVFGVYMGSAFAPNHKGMPIIAPSARLDFFSKQVRTSRNIRGGWWATTLMGGLNYQVEHHLFPNMARPYLAQARLIVREHCRTLNVPYTETSLWRSYGIVVQYLNRVGLAARDPFECPMISEYRPS